MESEIGFEVAARYLPSLRAEEFGASPRHRSLFASRQRAAAHPRRDHGLRRPRAPVSRLARARPDHPLSAGDRQHRPRVRAVHRAAAAEHQRRGFRALLDGAREVFPLHRSHPRRLQSRRPEARRATDDRLRSRIPLARGRPARLPSAAAATAGRWHRDEGIYLLWGTRDRGHGPAGNRKRRPGLCHPAGAPRPAAGSGHRRSSPAGGRGFQLAPGPRDYRARYKPYEPAGIKADEAANAEEIARLRALGYLGSREETAPVTRDRPAPPALTTTRGCCAGSAAR